MAQSDGKTNKSHTSALSPDEEIFIPIDLRPKWATAWKKPGTKDFFKGVKHGESHAGPSKFYLSRRRASLPPNADILPMPRLANRRESGLNVEDDATLPERLKSRHGSIPNSEEKLPQLHSRGRRASLPPNSKFLPGQSKLLDRRGSLPENTMDAPAKTPTPSRMRNRRASLPNSSSLEAYAKFRECNRDKLIDEEVLTSPKIFTNNGGLAENLSLSPFTRRRSLLPITPAHSRDTEDLSENNTSFPNRSQISPRRILRPVTPVPSSCAAGIEQLYPEVYLTPKPPKDPPIPKEQTDLNQVNLSSSEIAENKKEVTTSKSNGVDEDQNDNFLNLCPSNTSNSDSSSFVDSADDEYVPTNGEGWVKTLEMMTMNPSAENAFAEVFSTYMSKKQFERILNWLDDVEEQKTKVVRTGNNDFAVIRD